MDIYVYYSVASDHATQFAKAAAAMQSTLSQAYHIASALKRRPEIQNGHHTWMEVYEIVPDNFTQTLEKAVVDNGIDSLIEGQRHIEFFISVFSSTGS
ncbi:MAG: DUF4936 family protein [Glaciimonas sp.]|nr:DUF4936 family protein [Glaciimonas sp.]